MPYVAEKPRSLIPSSEDLRSRIPGWGVDLQSSDRPGVPHENFRPDATGAHWKFPERQPQSAPRERSSEHKFVTPVFGTTCPPRGLSGVVRRFAYRFSEGQARHWLLLLGADRIDVVEGRLKALFSGRPDSRFLEMGVLSEFRQGGGLSERLGKGRADVKHQWIDVLYFAAPYVLTGAAIYLLVRRRRR